MTFESRSRGCAITPMITVVLRFSRALRCSCPPLRLLVRLGRHPRQFRELIRSMLTRTRTKENSNPSGGGIVPHGTRRNPPPPRVAISSLDLIHCALCCPVFYCVFYGYGVAVTVTVTVAASMVCQVQTLLRCNSPFCASASEADGIRCTTKTIAPPPQPVHGRYHETPPLYT